ncbi:MAG: CBS domain-containing protein [Chloroflexi bacterium]|nr:CBS domain-containing protein [Chloroflexota bacterium]
MAKLLVRNWMSKNVITVSPKTSLPETHELMKSKKIRRVPVVDHERLVGILTLGDVREANASDASSLSIYELNYLLSRLTVDKIMTKDPLTIGPDAELYEAADLMLKHKIGGLPVMEDGKLVGVITESDIFKALVYEAKMAQAGDKIMQEQAEGIAHVSAV